MGWLVSDRPLTHETLAAYLTRHYTGETTEACSEVLAASQVGRAVYMAVRHTHKEGEHAGQSYVDAAVILVFNNAKDGFGDHVRQGGVIWGVVEVAIGQAAMVAISVGTTSIVVGMSSAMASVCM